MLLQRHKAIFWYAFGVGLLNYRGGGVLGWGCFKGHALCKTGFEEFLYRNLSLSFKAQCLPQMEGGGGGGGVVSSWVSCYCKDILTRGYLLVHTYIHTYFILFGVLYMVHQHCSK